MGFMDPNTGDWVNDDGTISPSGLVNQQNSATSPAWAPPPPAPTGQPDPWLGGPAQPPAGQQFEGPVEMPGDRAPQFEGPVEMPGDRAMPASQGLPDDIMPISPEFTGEEPVMPTGPNGMPEMPEIQPQDVTIRTGNDMIQQPGGEVGSPEEMPPIASDPNSTMPPTLAAQTPMPEQAPPASEPAATPPVSQTPGNELAPLSTSLPVDNGSGAPAAPGSVPENLQLTPPALIAGDMAKAGPAGEAPAPPVAPGGPQGAQGAPDTIQGLTAQEVENRRAQGEIDAKEALAKVNHANEVAQMKTQAAKDAQSIIAQGEGQLAAARAQQKMDFDKYRAMGEKSVWGDNQTRNMVLAGLAIMLGGRTGIAAVTGALEGLEQKKKTELAMQEKVMAQNGKTTEEIKEHTNAALADWQTRKAAGLDATAARAEAELAAQGVPQSEISTNKDVLALKSKGLEAQQKADQLAHKNAEDTIHDALANRKMELEAQIAQAKLDAARRKGKSGGEGSPGATKGAIELSKAIEDGVVGNDGVRRPLSWTEKQQKAAEVGIPLDGKAGHTTLKSINSEIAFDANQERKGAGGTGIEKQVNARMNDYQKEAIGNARSPGPVKTLTQIEEMRTTLDDAVASGDSDRIKAAAIKAKEQAGTIMSGGKLTNAQIKILHDLESTVDHVTSSIGKFTGNPTEGAGAVKRLRMVIMDAGKETSEQVSTIRQRAMTEHLGPGGLANTPEAKRTFLNRANGLFSGATWNDKPLFAEGKAAEALNTPTPTGSGAAPLQIKTASDKALMIKARQVLPGDPNYDSAQTWLRAHGAL